MNPITKLEPQTYAIIGAVMEVHRILGNGFLKGVYQEALELEFRTRSISYSREFVIPVCYKKEELRTRCRADFLCFDSIIVELRAIKALTEIETAQLIHYLKATGLERGLLLNFAASSLDFKRFINSRSTGE